MGARSKWKLKEGSALRVLTTVCLEAERSGDFGTLLQLSFLPQFPIYSKGKLVWSLRKSPRTASTVPIPRSPLGRGVRRGCGDGRKYSWSSLGRVRGGRDGRTPGLALGPRGAFPSPGSARRPEALPLRYDPRADLPPLRGTRAERFSAHLSSSGMWGSRVRPAVGFDPEAGY